MFNFFKKHESKNSNISSISIASLLIHAARIDENYSEKEKNIIKETLLKLGINNSEIDIIIEKAEIETTRRPSTLTMFEWEKLYESWKNFDSPKNTPGSIRRK